MEALAAGRLHAQEIVLRAVRFIPPRASIRYHSRGFSLLVSDLLSLGFVKSRRAWERCQLVGLVQDVDEVILATG